MENKLTYTKVGDYYIPNLTIKPSPPLGKYGRMRRDYLRNHRPALYNRLILHEQLQEHCAEVNESILIPKSGIIRHAAAIKGQK